MKKILMIADWDISHVEEDKKSKQPADLVVSGQRYWFFKYWPFNDIAFDVVGRKKNYVVDLIEKKILKFNISTAAHYFFMRRYDLVICFHLQAGFILALIRWLFRVNDPPLVLFDIEGIGRVNMPIIRGLVNSILNNVTLFFCFASVQQEDYAKYYPNIIPRTKLLRWGVDLSRYPMEGDILEEDMIITIGYQGPGFRDWVTLMDAWRIVSPRYKTKLVIVGREKLSARERGGKSMPDRVEFMGWRDLEQMNLLTRKARFVVLALPEKRRAHGQMTLLGCMALGKAVIVSKISGIIDCVKDGETAFLSLQGDPQDMAEKIKLLLDNPHYAAAIGRSAREEIRKYYREDQMGENICNLINNKIRGHNT